jgi:hypothetical protein
VTLFGANNQNACFNGSDPKIQRGEALSIRQMIDAMIARHFVDPSRVYVGGLSRRRRDGRCYPGRIPRALRGWRYRCRGSLWLRQDSG